ncbi:MAG: HEAT repeat domain-containing protein [Deltaproteobacteria bacterium]|nr:HEAT repeat domain-containing protein [Deltaproteobacteria bacterium]
MGKASPKSILISCVILFLISGIMYLSIRNTQEVEEAKSTCTTEQQKAKTSIVPADQKDDRTSADSGKHFTWYDSALEALSDPNGTARVQAILSLRNYPTPEAVDILSRFLDDKETAVVSEAIDTLGVIGSDSEIKDLVLNLLEEKARDKEFSARGQALITASMLGKDNRMLPVISDYISEGDDTGRDLAVRAMSFIASPECIPHLSKLLDESDDQEIHENASHILAEIDTPEAFSILHNQLISLDEDRQSSTAWALSVQNSPEFNDVLKEAIADNTLRKGAISIVATSAAAPAVFSELLQDDDIKKEDKIFWLKILAEKTIDSSVAVRSGVASAVEPLLNSEERDLEIQAIKTLGELGAEIDATAQVLAPKFKSNSLDVRKAALEAYYSYCTPNTYKELETLWWDKEENIRRSAFSLSESFFDSSDREVLENATKHTDEFISKQSKSILEQLP